MYVHVLHVHVIPNLGPWTRADERNFRLQLYSPPSLPFTPEPGCPTLTHGSHRTLEDITSAFPEKNDFVGPSAALACRCPCPS